MDEMGVVKGGKGKEKEFSLGQFWQWRLLE